MKPRTAAFALLGCLLVGGYLDELDARDREHLSQVLACEAAYRAAVDAVEGPEVALEDAALDAYEVPECQGLPVD